MQKQRKIPQRQCVGCRTMKDKKALVRIVKTPEGEICVDATGKKSGRGAYICPDASACKRPKVRAWSGPLRRPSERTFTRRFRRRSRVKHGEDSIIARPGSQGGRVEIGEEPVGSAARAKKGQDHPGWPGTLQPAPCAGLWALQTPEAACAW